MSGMDSQRMPILKEIMISSFFGVVVVVDVVVVVVVSVVVVVDVIVVVDVVHLLVLHLRVGLAGGTGVAIFGSHTQRQSGHTGVYQ